MSDSTDRSVEASLGSRVFVYRDDEGTVYYSFAKASSIILPPKRLKMQDRMGHPVVSFLAEFRRLGELLRRGEG